MLILLAKVQNSSNFFRRYRDGCKCKMWGTGGDKSWKSVESILDCVTMVKNRGCRIGLSLRRWEVRIAFILKIFSTKKYTPANKEIVDFKAFRTSKQIISFFLFIKLYTLNVWGKLKFIHLHRISVSESNVLWGRIYYLTSDTYTKDYEDN